MKKLSIRDIASQVANGTFSVESRVQQKLKIIDEKNTALNALVHIERDESLRRARELDIAISKKSFLGRLAGSTFSTRISINVKGMPTGNGSLTEEPLIASSSSAIIEKLLAQGAVCLGKGNIAEKGRSYFSENPRYGRTNHPLDLTLSPGGSGGGDAAAISAGLVDFAIGADAGGSVRIPANFCGLYGLSATPGRLSESGQRYPSNTIIRLLKSMGILARTLDDLEIIYSLVEGFDSRDPYSSDCYLAPQPLTNRFLICNSMNGVLPDTEIQAALNEAQKRFEALGFSSSLDTPAFFNPLIESFVVMAGQGQLLLEDSLAERENRPIDKDKEGIHIKALRKRLAEELPALTVENFLYHWYQIDQARIQVSQLFQNFDFILMPVSATLPVAHMTSQYMINGKGQPPECVFQFATLVNTLGLPAIAVPSHTSAKNLPVGFQVVAPRFQESLLFGILRKAGY